MRLLVWNVQGAVPPNGSKQRIQDQLEFIESNAGSPDLVMLNEVTTVQRNLWRAGLNELGYDVVDTLDWAAELRESTVPPHQDFNHTNGNLIALHETADAQNLTRQTPSIRYGRWEDAVLKDWSTNFPEKIHNASFDMDDSTVEVWNIRAIPGSMWGEEKIKILENVYNRIKKREHHPTILGGDFNSPKGELPDGTVVPWGLDREEFIRDRWIGAEIDVFTGLEDLGIVDVFRARHGYGDLDVEDVSFETRRFDHLFASKELTLKYCRYDTDGYKCSDHAPLLAELEL